MCLAADLALLSSLVDLIRLSIRVVSAFTDCPSIEPPFRALEVTLKTGNERVSTLEWQVTSKDIEIAAKTTHMSNLERHVKMAEGRVSLMSELSASSTLSWLTPRQLVLWFLELCVRQGPA